MSNVFGDGGAGAAARKSQAQARRQEQRGNEDEQRARQMAERGATAGRGRNMLVGRLASMLPQKLGGGS